MNEISLRNLLIQSTLAPSVELTRTFLRDVVGLEPEPGAAYRYLTEATWENAGQQRALVVSIAPLAGVGFRDQRYGAGSRVDAAILDRTAVLLELKIAGQAEHAQLLRHARHWALALPAGRDGAESELGTGFALRTWSHVLGWVGREFERADLESRDRARLRSLAVALRELGLGEPDYKLAPAGRAVPADVDHPAPVPTREMTDGINLSALHDACARLYGRNGSHHVAATGCRADAAVIRAAHERDGLPVPSGLEGNPMTPRRVLSVLYGNLKLTDAAPAAWTDLRQRLLPRGADRAVLVALLAWADRNPTTSAATRLNRAVARVWSQTPERNPGFDELHAAIAMSDRG